MTALHHLIYSIAAGELAGSHLDREAFAPYLEMLPAEEADALLSLSELLLLPADELENQLLSVRPLGWN
jgi:hypothetical protein